MTIHGIRKTHSKVLLVKLKFSKGGRGRLDTAWKEVIGATGTVRHFIPRIEVKIGDIEPSIEAEDVEDPVRGFFDHASELELKASLAKRPFPRKQESVRASGGGAGLEITQGDPNQNRVGLLQGLLEDGGKSMLPLPWPWPHGGELLDARP